MKKVIIALVCLLLVGVGAYWFLNRDNDKARDVVPKTATAVAVIEPGELCENLGLKLEDVLKLASAFGDVEGTIDFSKPVYAFTTESGMTGVSLNVADADKLLKLIENVGFASEEQQGFKWVANDNTIGCVGKDKMLVFSPVSVTQQDALRTEMVKLMEQSRQDVPALEKAQEQKGVVQVSAPLASLPKQYAASLPGDVDISKGFFNCALRIDKKAIAYSAKLDGVENLNIPLNEIKGNLIGLEPEDPLAWICVNMKGEELLPYLREIPQLRSVLLGLNLGVDADMMIKAIDGDVSLAVPEAELTPNFLLTATLKNTDFLKNAADWDVERRSDTDFVINAEDNKVYFGVRDDKLYIASSEALANKACKKADAEDYQEAAKGKFLGVSLDAEKIVGVVSKEFSSTALVLNIPQVRDVVDALERVSLTADTRQSVELSVETDKPIKDIVSKLWTLLTGK